LYNSNNNILLLLPSSRHRWRSRARGGMGTRIDGPGRVPGVSRICPPPLNTAGWCHLARTHVFYFRRTHYAPTPTHTHSRAHTHTQTYARRTRAVSCSFVHRHLYFHILLFVDEPEDTPARYCTDSHDCATIGEEDRRLLYRGTPLLYRLVDTTLGSLGPYDRQRNCISRNS